ncbi:MAG: rod shape-determining protein MreC [Lachnospiraceae bacterium]|uniref:Cell shape-determining protein MreC n=1 Tax=Roseburia yibonii TaxID=2763063 RepID=A0ABR7I8J0_9FIRM|nr:rod shape-determining protein MreC [Roseburia yibonii]MCI5877524.1 rod shape-determining protein MreC [Lachnospiraceae bacterium]MEE0117425.1 rod shape-determining protein MreC [Lachnospiraceae bacterium]
MKRKPQFTLPTKYILLGMTVLCVTVMFLSFTFNLSGGPLNAVAGYVFVPMQKGINAVGGWMSEKADNLKNLNDVMQKNEELQAQVDELTAELNTIKLEQYDLDNYRALLELDDKYPSYKKVAANVIGKDSGNWFNTFIIDKGSKDGIEKDMNVIAGSGLVGIVTDVAPNYAKVKSIIDDTSSVSGMDLATSDNCIIRGNLQMMNENQEIELSDLKDTDDQVQAGDQIVTSYISDKYLQGILIGYIKDVSVDSNNLTKSGTITPVVDFEHIQEVLVILDKKEDVSGELSGQ